jgi:hypothetical protein
LDPGGPCKSDVFFVFGKNRLFFVIRLIINKINKVQWVDFKLENVLVSLHSLKTMGLGPFRASAPLFLMNGELLGHSPISNILHRVKKHSKLSYYLLIFSKNKENVTFTWPTGVQNVLFFTITRDKFTIYVPIHRYGDFNTLPKKVYLIHHYVIKFVNDLR